MNGLFARIRWRLVAWSVLVLVLILLAVGSSVYVIVANSLLTEVDGTLASRAQVALADPRDLSEGRPPLVGEQGYRGGLFYVLIDASGTVLADPQSANLDPATLRSLAQPGPAYRTVDDSGPVRLYITPLRVNNQTVGALVVGQSIASQEDALRQLLLVLLGSGVVGLLLSLLGGWFLAGRALVPIQRAFTRQQQFVADASHELRTPLTVLRSATELLAGHAEEPLSVNRDLFDAVRDEIARLERLALDLLTLARSDLGELDLAVAPMDLSALAAQTTRRVEPLAASRGVKLAFAGDGPLPVEADPDRLQQVLLILLDNALKHTPAGGTVTVAAQRQGGDVSIMVKDTGPGIPPEQLARVFERFYRADEARTRDDGGAGLGLAIAKALVEAHGGRLTLASAVGQGTVASIHMKAGDPDRSTVAASDPAR